MGWTVGARRWTAGLAATLMATGALVVATAAPAAAESLAQLSVSDSSVAEPTTGTANMLFTIKLLRVSTRTVIVNYRTNDDTAIAGRDYTTSSGRLVFAPGSTVKTAAVPVLANSLATGDRQFQLTLNGAVDAVIADGSANGVIDDTSANSYLSVSDTAVVTGYAQATTATFNVTLDAPSTNTVSVRYGTSDQSARAGQQYTATAGTLTFAPGVTSMPVSVPVLGKVPPGTRQSFLLGLSAAVNASIVNGTGQAAITDPDSRAYFTVDDTVITRPTTGSANATVTVRLLQPLTYASTVNYRTSDGSAVAGTDYTASSGTLNFAAGDLTKTFTVPVQSGAAGNRYFNTILSGVSFGTGPVRSGYVQIADPSAKPQVSVQDAGVARPLSGNGAMTFTITANPAPTSSLTVNYSTSNGSAIEGTDFIDVAASVTFSPGQTSKTVTVQSKGTSLPVGDKSFNFTISAPNTADVLRNTAAGVLVLTNPNQFAPVLSVRGSATTVPTTGSATTPFVIQLSPAADETVTVDYSTANGSAVTGADYTSTTGTATFPAGTTAVTVNVPITTKTTPAGDKSFYLQIGNPTNAVIGQEYYAYDVLRNAVATPVVAVQDTAIYPNDATSVNVQVFVKLSTPALSTVSVDYGTANGSAVSGVDYVSKSGTLTFPAGTTSQSLTVRIPKNAKVLGTRYFNVNLGNPQNARINQTSGTVYILANKATPYVSVTGSTVVTGAAATTAPFTFAVSTRTDAPVTVNWSTGNGSAQAGTQYTASSGTATIPAGQLSTTVNVPVAADTVSVDPTSFYVQITGVTNAVTAAQNFSYAVLEHSTVRPRISVRDVVVTRQTTGNRNAVFTVTLSGASTANVTVDYGTSNGSAIAGTDYTATTGTLTFAPGDTSKTVSVPITAGAAANPDQYFYLYFSNPVNAAVTRNPGYALIQSANSTTPQLTIDDGYAVAPTSGTTNMVFTLRLNPAPTTPVNISYSTSDNSARDGFDYTYTQGTVTFPAGTTSRNVTVPVLAHPQAAADLGFTLSAGAPNGGVAVQRGSAAGVIVTPVVGAYLFGSRDISVIRGTSGTQTGTATVTLSPAQTVPVSVDYNTVDNSGIAGRDYTPTSGTLTFAPGQTSATIDVDVLGSATVSGNVAFYIQLANPRGANLGAVDDGRVWVYVDAVDTWVMSGKVTTAANAPIGGVRITRTGNNLPTLATTTAPDGTWSLPASTTGDYVLTPTKTGSTFTPASLPVTVDGSGPVTGLNFTGS